MTFSLYFIVIQGETCHYIMLYKSKRGKMTLFVCVKACVCVQYSYYETIYYTTFHTGFEICKKLN